MSSYLGERIHISIFGQSHSAKIGVVIDGLPAGMTLDTERLADFMRRRAPGQSSLTTARREADEIEIVSGIANGKLCGAPLCVTIENTDIRPGDYSEFTDKPRPSHADFTAQIKYGGHQDASGGGHFSGRLTAPLCAAGGICMQLLESEGVFIGSHIKSISDIDDDFFDMVTISRTNFKNLTPPPLTVINPAAAEKMAAAIAAAREESDSVGGVIECAAIGLRAGLGNPIFGGMENRIAQIIFGIPAVRGIEFGNGFASARLCGSENNDNFIIKDGKITTETNNHGGILGGITSGMPLIFRVAIKPTPSIGKPQKTVSLSGGTPAEIKIRGRHDPCIVPRALPCVEAAAAIAVLDAYLTTK